MRQIMVLNSKGGCGKSTLATNIAAYYANEGKNVVLADFDPQESSLHWLKLRPGDRPGIRGIAAYKDGLNGLNGSTDYVVMDAPARSHGPELRALLEHVETVVMPVLPSEIDMQASRSFLEELSTTARFARREARLALVGNRVREYTVIYDNLDEFLRSQRPAYLGSLRDAQNYVRAFKRGLSIFELPEYLAWPDWGQWEPLIEWLDGPLSQP